MKEDEITMTAKVFVQKIAHRLMQTSLYIIINMDNPAVGRNIKAGYMRSRQLAISETRIQLQWAGLRTLCDARIAKCRGLSEEALICTAMKQRGVANVGCKLTECTRPATKRRARQSTQRLLESRMGPHSTRARQSRI